MFLGVLVCALVGGSLAAWHVAAQGLTLSHYDARAHLVVARRIWDSLTPGWQQIGAVWLPLPHLINAIPVQWDWAYRSGAVGVGISVGILSCGLAALAHRLFVRTRSWPVALVPPALILANPNVLYLQSTPMTEPMLMGLSLLSLSAMDSWIEAPDFAARRRAAWFVAALVLTRYEGWLIAAALLGIATMATYRRGARECVALWMPSALAIAAFLLLSYGSTGRWFLSPDFFVLDAVAWHQPLKATGLVVWGLNQLAGPVLVAAGAAGALVAIGRGRRQLAAVLPLALLLSGLLPLAAFYAGHPFRIRYMVPLIAACGVLAGVALSAVPRRARTATAVALVAVVLWMRPPVDASAPMVVEAQWDTPFRHERERVSDGLRRAYDGTPILASMGSLAPYMHEASAIGLDLRNFLHEGNGYLWKEALRNPRLSVRWVLIEERAEGGGPLAARARTDPEFLAGFARVADGGGLVLYRRKE